LGFARVSSTIAHMNEFPKGAALVVGGSGGVGAAVCEALARAGSDVAVGYRSDLGAAREVVARLEAMGAAATPVFLDLALAPSGEVATLPPGCPGVAVAQAVAWRPLHTLVYAAGPSIPMQWVSKIRGEDLAHTLDIDVQGFFRVLQAALPHLRDASGSIVAVTTAALVRYPARDALSAVPKAALEALLRAVAKEEGRFGVRANSVAIGVVDAGMFKRLRDAGELDDEWLAASRRNTPLGREATATEVAEAVRFLASRRAGFITGQRLVVDGGYSV
jgi:3-oxoacyl-[acyl-carrier protein] reductase